MKKLILVALAAAGAVVRQEEDGRVGKEQALWASATDDVAKFPDTTRRPEPPASSPAPPGALAQLVAHLLCKQGVRGSSPLGSTTRSRRSERSVLRQAASDEIHRGRERWTEAFWVIMLSSRSFLRSPGIVPGSQLSEKWVTLH